MTKKYNEMEVFVLGIVSRFFERYNDTESYEKIVTLINCSTGISDEEIEWALNEMKEN